MTPPPSGAAFLGMLRRDLLIACRSPVEVLNPPVFFVIVVVLFRLGTGPGQHALSALGPGVVWVGALLATLLGLDALFRADFEDGSLEQILLCPAPLPLLVGAKVLAHWLVAGLPLLLLSPLLAGTLGLPAAALPVLAGAGLSRPPTGELFDVVRPFGGTPLAQCDRALLPTFGFPGYGVHVVGYVAHADGPRIWIPRRAADREVAPGQLDNTVAGGIAAGMSAAATLRKEAREEAGLEPALVDAARPAGALAYLHQEGECLRDDTLFVYDLPMPPEFRPRNLDGEVQDFALMPWRRVLELLRDGAPFKFNCGPVLLDFLLRHGLLDPDREPAYSGLARTLRRPAP